MPFRTIKYERVISERIEEGWLARVRRRTALWVSV